MNDFKLSRRYWDWAFRHQEIRNPTHAALYGWFLEYWNRMNWAEKFEMAPQYAMTAIGVSSYNTYKKALADLVGVGFVKVVREGCNQYAPCMIALSNFDEPLNETYKPAVSSAVSKNDRPRLGALDKPRDAYTKYINLKPKQKQNSAEAPFWSLLLKRGKVYENWATYKLFLRKERKKNTPRCAAPPLSENQFAYEYEAGKTEILQWPDSFSQAMRAFFLTEWLPYHRKRGGKRLTVQGVKLQLTDLSGIPDTSFFDTLNKAIKSNWQSFHVKPDTHASPGQNAQPTSSAAAVTNFGQGAVLPGGSAYRKQVIRRGTTAGTGHS